MAGRIRTTLEVEAVPPRGAALQFDQVGGDGGGDRIRVFGLFLALVLLLGAFALHELGAVDRVSTDIRDRWLQSTRVLGDLNNYTSDARAAEASRLLARSPAQQADVDRQIAELNRSIQ
ncbi:MAG: hypothetical protein WA840_16770 [Caulobacteraceae bacterium]